MAIDELHEVRIDVQDDPGARETPVRVFVDGHELVLSADRAVDVRVEGGVASVGLVVLARTVTIYTVTEDLA